MGQKMRPGGLCTTREECLDRTIIATTPRTVDRVSKLVYELLRVELMV
jgi:hypothetical protein